MRGISRRFRGDQDFEKSFLKECDILFVKILGIRKAFSKGIFYFV